MADEHVLASVRKYLRVLREDHHLDVSGGVLFGSFAKGHADEWSDIDLVVLARRFDGGVSREDVQLLWWVAAATDSRIEPIPCGERQWLEDDKSALLEIARREGTLILPGAA